MNEEHDPLEAELAALQPRPLTAAVRRRLAERLAEPAVELPRWRVPLLAGLAALVCLATLVVAGNELSRQRWTTSVVEPAPKPTPPEAVAPPTLQAYQRALAESPEALDALLARQAARDLERAAPLRPLHPFVLSRNDPLED